MENSYSSLRVGVGKFVYGQNAVLELTPEIARLGCKPLVIGGTSSMKTILNQCSEAWRHADIEPVLCTHTDGCTRAWAQHYAEMAHQKKCSVIVGIGGGKCMDLAKAIATVAKMDCINVPLSVATCAASSAVCIMYHENGTPDGSIAMDKEVDVVIADTNLIATAPKRLLAAGIFDSIAKLPEVIHNTHIEKYTDCPIEKYICTINSQAIYAFLLGEGLHVYQNGIASGRMTDVILVNLLHTSVVSGFSSGVNQLAMAHGYYDFMRRSFTQEAAHVLHGELVAVGILMQMHFNGQSEEEIAVVRDLMKEMQMPVTLRTSGFSGTDAAIESLLEYLLTATGLNAKTDRASVHAAIQHTL